MRLAMHRAAEAALGLAALVLVGVLVAPWREPPLPDPSAAGKSPVRTVPVGAAAASQASPPEVILPLLVGRPAPRAAAQAAAPTPPVDASWMRYLGRSQSADGATQVYMKDTKSGKLITASKNAGADGWVLVQELADKILVKNGDTVYSVGKR
jgi:hypothetical protein